jgi:hypothetical protein
MLVVALHAQEEVQTNDTLQNLNKPQNNALIDCVMTGNAEHIYGHGHHGQPFSRQIQTIMTTNNDPT